MTVGRIPSGNSSPCLLLQVCRSLRHGTTWARKSRHLRYDAARRTNSISAPALYRLQRLHCLHRTSTGGGNVGLRGSEEHLKNMLSLRRRYTVRYGVARRGVPWNVVVNYLRVGSVKEEKNLLLLIWSNFYSTYFSDTLPSLEREIREVYRKRYE